ncbi:MAG: COX15/CtaA family protein, partial [Verrucomicrobiae bacterium]|nr:COX15/CtaA family protein [Verrucomicrobiae bacterium]
MPQKPPLSRLLLHVFLLLTALATLFLLCIGGLVTSTGSGLAVPDWPTSYGYNMFLFPISQWFSDRGIFYEHSHRLVASGVGFMTIILCVWIWVVERARPWLCWLGTAALVLVIIQGVLGGLRVVWLRNEMGLIHACLAQGFFVLVCFLALVTSPAWWRMWEKPPGTSSKCVGGFFKWSLALTLLIYVQLMVGAGMRHAHAGLAIPDWPLAYGQVWPKTDPATLKSLNEKRWEVRQMPTTAVQIHLQM